MFLRIMAVRITTSIMTSFPVDLATKITYTYKWVSLLCNICWFRVLCNMCSCHLHDKIMPVYVCMTDNVSMICMACMYNLYDRLWCGRKGEMRKNWPWKREEGHFGVLLPSKFTFSKATKWYCFALLHMCVSEEQLEWSGRCLNTSRFRILKVYIISFKSVFFTLWKPVNNAQPVLWSLKQGK